MILFSDRGCAFAHRVRALLDHLQCPVDLRESMVGEKPEALYQYSSSGRSPLLVHGDLVLMESRVMLEHLAEYYAFEDSYPTSPGSAQPPSSCHGGRGRFSRSSAFRSNGRRRPSPR